MAEDPGAAKRVPPEDANLQPIESTLHASAQCKKMDMSYNPSNQHPAHLNRESTGDGKIEGRKRKKSTSHSSSNIARVEKSAAKINRHRPSIAVSDLFLTLAAIKSYQDTRHLGSSNMLGSRGFCAIGVASALGSLRCVLSRSIVSPITKAATVLVGFTAVPAILFTVLRNLIRRKLATPTICKTIAGLIVLSYSLTKGLKIKAVSVLPGGIKMLNADEFHILFGLSLLLFSNAMAAGHLPNV